MIPTDYQLVCKTEKKISRAERKPNCCFGLWGSRQLRERSFDSFFILLFYRYLPMTGWKRRLQGSLYHRKVIALSGSRRKIVRSKRDLSDREICLLLLHEVEHRQLWTPTLLLLARRSQDQGLAQLVHLLTRIQGLVGYRHRPAHRWLGADWVLQLTGVAVQGTVFSRVGVLHVKGYWLYRMAAVAAFRSISSSSSNIWKIGRTILSPSPQPRSNLFLPPTSFLLDLFCLECICYQITLLWDFSF